MNTVYLCIGGNIGNRQLMLTKALRFIENRIGDVIRSSSVYETAAWGNSLQSPFLNQVIKVRTDLKAEEVLKIILSIEESMGRIRGELRWQDRIIDIDILFYNVEIIKKENLVVPHPEIQNRRFVLIPMNEIEPEFLHPSLKKTIKQLLEDCEDELLVRPFTENQK